MGKWFAGAGLVVFLGFAVGGCSVLSFGWSSYNNLVTSSNKVDAQWAQVENVYQRRADLVPNLVETVRGYAIHENETFVAVTEARAKVGQITIGAGSVTSENLAAFQAAQGELSSALSRLMVVVEKYPDLKSSTLFSDLMVQMEGTENRISVERGRYNTEATEYNITREKFPTNVVANFFQFGSKPYFKAEEGAKTAPKVDFKDLRK
ncbi:MAG: LemA family protein [Candidatus Taylorbacteria bacterium]|nr:LemA family protein [Candidatus Taylorbacteria bacterium]